MRSKQQELESRKRALISDNKILSSAIDEQIKIKKANQKELVEIEKELSLLLEPKGVHITDHALVRFLERAKELDVQALKQELISPELLAQISVLGGTGKFPYKEGHFVMEDFTIITYITAD